MVGENLEFHWIKPLSVWEKSMAILKDFSFFFGGAVVFREWLVY